jgi:cobalt/nickel transport system permease protein
VLVLTTVVSVQALIFQDGGLLALGANIFNMAVVGVAVSYVAYTTIVRLARSKKGGIYAAGFVAAWLSIVVASLGVGLQLALSGTSPANLAIPAMAAIHSIIGIGEGLITVGALALVYASRPDLLKSGQVGTKGSKVFWVAGLLLAVSLAILSPLASTHPDGVMWVAQQKGFLDNVQGPIYNIIPKYMLPGVSNQALATILAGLAGIVIVLGVTLGVAYLRRNRKAADG